MPNQTTDDIKQELILADDASLDLYEQSDNDLIDISFSKNGFNYNITPKFQQVLAQSRRLADESTALLQGTTPATVDEEELSRIRDEMKPVKAYRKDVDDTLKDIRRVFNGTRDNFVDYVSGLLAEADFNIIEKNEEHLKKLNKDVLALRKKQNWDAVEDTFMDALDMYPELPKLYPKRLDFDVFASENEKLVSGSKTWRLNDAVVNTIKMYIQNVYTNNEVIKRLGSTFESELVKRYDQTGNIQAALDLEDKYKIEEAEALKRQQQLIEKEAERKAKEMERKRQTEERARLQAEAEAKQKAAAAEKARQEAANAAANPKPAVADAPFGMKIPPAAQPIQDRTAVMVADRVGFTKLAKRMRNEEWSITSLESMDLLHRFLDGVYKQEAGIVELIKSPDQVMELVKEFVAHTI